MRLLLPLLAALVVSCATAIGWRAQWSDLCPETSWEDFRAAGATEPSEQDSAVLKAVLDRYASHERGSIELDLISTSFPVRASDFDRVFAIPQPSDVAGAFAEPNQLNTPGSVRHHPAVLLGSSGNGPTAEGVTRLVLSDPIFCQCGGHAAVAISTVQGRRKASSALLLGRAGNRWLVVGRDEFASELVGQELPKADTRLEEALRGRSAE